MAVSRRESTLRRVALLSLPLLLAAAFAVNGWRDVEEHLRRSEFRVQPASAATDFAGATWRLDQVRLIGDGRDTKQIFPGGMRLVIVRLSADAKQAIGEAWAQCRLRLTDGESREWAPLDVILSANLSRDLDPKAEPIAGCGIASLHPPGKSGSTLIEEKFVVPADAASHLSAQLSFGSTRPSAIRLPLYLK